MSLKFSSEIQASLGSRVRDPVLKQNQNILSSQCWLADCACTGVAGEPGDAPSLFSEDRQPGLEMGMAHKARQDDDS